MLNGLNRLATGTTRAEDRLAVTQQHVLRKRGLALTEPGTERGDVARVEAEEGRRSDWVGTQERTLHQRGRAPNTAITCTSHTTD